MKPIKFTLICFAMPLGAVQFTNNVVQQPQLTSTEYVLNINHNQRTGFVAGSSETMPFTKDIPAGKSQSSATYDMWTNNKYVPRPGANLVNEKYYGSMGQSQFFAVSPSEFKNPEYVANPLDTQKSYPLAPKTLKNKYQ